MKKLKKYITLVPLTALCLALSGCGSPKGTGFESYKAYGEQIEDRKIVNNIRAKFHSDPSIPDSAIYIAIDRGIVQLSGFVRNAQAADLALLSAKNTPRVKDVIDNLVVLSDADYAKRRAVAEERSTKR